MLDVLVSYYIALVYLINALAETKYKILTNFSTMGASCSRWIEEVK